MKLHQLHHTTLLKTSIEDAWIFFTNPRNLAEITPGDMGFTVLTPDLPEKIHSGLLIRYRVRPLGNIPVSWVTEIKEVASGSFFVDEQLKGPYRYWRHEHRFASLGPDEVRMEDFVVYALPLGWLGNIIGLSIVRKKLASIFQYRLDAIKRVFPGSKSIT